MVVAIAMAFDIGLVHHVKAVFGGQFVPAFGLRIMGVPYSVEIGGLHQSNVFEHGLFIHHVTVDVMVLVQVGTLEFNQSAIDHESAVFDLDGPKTNTLGNRFERFASFGAECDQQAVLVWVFCRPRPDVADNACNMMTRSPWLQQ